ncbi:MAG: 2OG-Fe(II) oxygenase, partial [Deltaproteobacteria bacterium]|nr:2OG-Fe(II) oxygenase [Deltaproteobacteria bacterium]
MTESSALKTVDMQRLKAALSSLRAEYAQKKPFPHIVLEDFLERPHAEQAMVDFPGADSDQWLHYKHFNENKLGQSKLELMPDSIAQVIRECSSAEFCAFLSELTGIPNLIPDPDLDGGGLHQSARGGFLRVHTDFTTHPKHPTWQRRVNLLVYLNKDWLDSYGGHLELWDVDMQSCQAKIAPTFNRCTIFTTGTDTFHGLPHPLTCPEGMTRKSIALYYFTESSGAVSQSTYYKPLPEDSGIKRLL